MVWFAIMLVSVAAPLTDTEAAVLAYGKRLDVHRIDSRLKSERFQSWVERTLGRDATVTWDADDCREGEGDSSPLCISAEARLSPHGRVVLSVAVGSVQGGIGGKPALFLGAIEGLGPTESIETGDLPLLTSKLRAARALDAELSQLPDVPIDDDAWIRQVQQTPAARVVPGASGDAAPFGDWVAARAGPHAKVEWFVKGCGPRARHNGPPVDLTGDKDEWAFVEVHLKDSDASVLIPLRVGTCRKGIRGNPIPSTAQLFDKRPRHIHIEHVTLDALESKLREIHVHH